VGPASRRGSGHGYGGGGSSATGRDEPRPPVERVIELLDGYYGRPVWAARHDAVEELVYTVLSQNTADVNTDRTYAELRRRFPTWSEVRDASVEEVEDAIALGGLAATKAPRIKAVLAAISERRGVPDLSELDELDDAAALAYLQELPGVGPKTAACVLLFALGRPAMPVDTHVHRVAGRLGLIGPGVSVEEAHRILTELAGLANVYALHVNLVRHGRAICHARRPECPRCPLVEICPAAERFLQEYRELELRPRRRTPGSAGAQEAR
jgi:endonuclease-3